MTPTNWHMRTVADTAQLLQTNLAHGLDTKEAEQRLVAQGLNCLAPPKSRNAGAVLARQFRSLIVGLLFIVGIVAFAMSDIIEGISITIVILLNAGIGFATEWKAAQALAGLRNQTIMTARTLRDGKEQSLPATHLVAGDIVSLRTGDRVAADGRICAQSDLRIAEASLTGESLPLAKSTAPLADAAAPLGDRACMVYAGTGVIAGRGTFIVTATGARTEMGQVRELLDKIKAPLTPLETKLAQLSHALLAIVCGLCGIIILAGWLRGNGLVYMVEVGISLAIAAVPEGLLAVTTMTLAVGMQRMATHHALVRRLPAVEALGATTVICSDKTGTLTRNEMTVCSYAIGGRRVQVTGVGYAAVGDFVEGTNVLTPVAHLTSDNSLLLALRIGALCNDARLVGAQNPRSVVGDPTEAALIVAAEKAGLQHRELRAAYPRLRELPFSSETKRMLTLHTAPTGGLLVMVKGSPAAVLDACVSVLSADGTRSPLQPTARTQLLATNEAMAARAERVLGLAYRPVATDLDMSDADLFSSLIFVGLVGMLDPLRDEAKATIARCRVAGIRTVMITGDQLGTASEIAAQLGLSQATDGTALRAVHGRELTALPAEDWPNVVQGAAVFARVSPQNKLQIVEALQGLGHIVAMTGDGANDAPALRKADIGIAMGIRGTEVAKDAAAIVITDDNFATIAVAVEQGRVIVHNILRFIHYLFSCNLSELLTVFVAIMVNLPLPLGVLQILWLNLVTDIFPAMALALEPSAPDVMARPPRQPKQPLLTLRFAWLITWQGLLLSACTLAAYSVGLHWYGYTSHGLHHASTITFMTLALAQTLHAFSVRSRKLSIFSTQLFTNGWLWSAALCCIALQLAAVHIPLLRTVLQTVPLHAADWGLIAGASVTPLIVIEALKLGSRWHQRHQNELVRNHID